jgi:EpsI family protein
VHAAAIARTAALALLASGWWFAFHEPLAAMVATWSRNPMYSYAFLVPAVAAALWWSRRESLLAATHKGSWRFATPVLTAACILLVVGRAGGILLLEQFAILVSILGVALAVLGPAFVRTGWAGFAYLLFMIPFWDPITDALHWPLQNYTAAIGTALLWVCGVPAYRDGVFVVLPNIALQVARACSGVNYQVAVLALGLPLAYTQLRSPWRRLALIAGAVVVAAFFNGVRAALIGLLAYWDLGAPLHGPFHVLHGLFVAAAGYAALFTGLGWLKETEDSQDQRVRAIHAGGSWLNIDLRAMACLALTFWMVGLTASADAVEPVALRERLTALPMRLGEWTARADISRASLPGEADGWQAADEVLRRQYAGKDGSDVDVLVGYFARQGQARELAGYTTADLHRRARRSVIALQNGEWLRVNVVRERQGTRVLLFWYELDGQPIAGRYATVAQTAWNGFVHRQSNGAVIMLAGSAESAARLAATESGMHDLAALVHNALRQSWPARGE